MKFISEDSQTRDRPVSYSSELPQKVHLGTTQHRKLSRSRTSLSEEHKPSKDREQSDVSQSFNSSPISLPQGYNPVSALSQLEMLYNFVFRNCPQQPPSVKNIQERDELRYQRMKDELRLRRVRDMQAIGCVIVELFLPSKCSVLSPKASLLERYSLCRSLLIRSNCSSIPRCLKYTLITIFQLNCKAFTADKLPNSYEPVTQEGLPPPSPYQLLQPLTDTFPFPLEFPKLHVFISRMCEYNHMKKMVCMSARDPKERHDKCQTIADTQINYASSTLPALLSSVEDEGVLLLVPYITELFRCPYSAVGCTYYLTSIVAQCLGPSQAAKHLLSHVVKLYEQDIITDKTLKIFHRSFLLQLSVWFGMKVFLANFITPLIEGVGGYKELTKGGPDTPDTSSRKLSTSLRY